MTLNRENRTQSDSHGGCGGQRDCERDQGSLQPEPTLVLTDGFGEGLRRLEEHLIFAGRFDVSEEIVEVWGERPTSDYGSDS